MVHRLRSESPSSRVKPTLENSRREYVLGDPFADARFFDLALSLDVVEHVEDCFGFVRQCGAKATWKIYHIPLDVSVSTLLRGINCWDSVGHLHLFTRETALKTVETLGSEGNRLVFDSGCARKAASPSD